MLVELLKDFTDFVTGNGKTERYTDLPHFENALNKGKVMRIIQKASFSPYTTKDGVVLENIAVSLRYPDNMEGVDFLFKCLGDVDEAYFRPAVLLLKSYPRKAVCRRIEENVKIALEKNDPVGLAGLMYFAQDIDYEIKCVQNMGTDMNSN